MLSSRPRYQFSLRVLFAWMLAISIFFALATLPFPVNGYLAPLYGSVLLAYFGSRSVWLATILGSLGCLAASWGIVAIEMSRHAAQFSMGLLPWIAGCLCTPLGGAIGLAVGIHTRERKNRERFQASLKALYEDLGTPASRETPSDVSPRISEDADSGG